MAVYLTVEDVWNSRFVSREWYEAFNSLVFPVFKRAFNKRVDQLCLPDDLLTVFTLAPTMVFSGSFPLSVLLGREDWKDQDLDAYVDLKDAPSIAAFLGPNISIRFKNMLTDSMMDYSSDNYGTTLLEQTGLDISRGWWPNIRATDEGYATDGLTIYLTHRIPKLIDISIVPGLSIESVAAMADIKATGICYDGYSLLVPNPNDTFHYRSVYVPDEDRSHQWHHTPRPPPFIGRDIKYKKRGFTLLNT